MSRNKMGGAKLRSMYACLNGSISHEKTWSTPSFAPYVASVALPILSSASKGDSVPEHMVATRRGRPSSLMRSLSSGSFLTMSLNIPCTSRIAGRSSASCTRDVVPAVPVTSVSSDLIFLRLSGCGDEAGEGGTESSSEQRTRASDRHARDGTLDPGRVRFTSNVTNQLSRTSFGESIGERKVKKCNFFFFLRKGSERSRYFASALAGENQPTEAFPSRRTSSSRRSGCKRCSRRARRGVADGRSLTWAEARQPCHETSSSVRRRKHRAPRCRCPPRRVPS